MAENSSVGERCARLSRAGTMGHHDLLIETETETTTKTDTDTETASATDLSGKEKKLE